jgi:hypothetical protein
MPWFLWVGNVTTDTVGCRYLHCECEEKSSQIVQKTLQQLPSSAVGQNEFNFNFTLRLSVHGVNFMFTLHKPLLFTAYIQQLISRHAAIIQNTTYDFPS